MSKVKVLEVWIVRFKGMVMPVVAVLGYNILNFFVKGAWHARGTVHESEQVTCKV